MTELVRKLTFNDRKPTKQTKPTLKSLSCVYISWLDFRQMLMTLVSVRANAGIKSTIMWCDTKHKFCLTDGGAAGEMENSTRFLGRWVARALSPPPSGVRHPHAAGITLRFLHEGRRSRGLLTTHRNETNPRAAAGRAGAPLGAAEAGGGPAGSPPRRPLRALSGFDPRAGVGRAAERVRRGGGWGGSAGFPAVSAKVWVVFVCFLMLLSTWLFWGRFPEVQILGKLLQRSPWQNRHKCDTPSLPHDPPRGGSGHGDVWGERGWRVFLQEFYRCWDLGFCFKTATCADFTTGVYLGFWLFGVLVIWFFFFCLVSFGWLFLLCAIWNEVPQNGFYSHQKGGGLGKRGSEIKTWFGKAWEDGHAPLLMCLPVACSSQYYSSLKPLPRVLLGWRNHVLPVCFSAVHFRICFCFDGYWSSARFHCLS